MLRLSRICGVVTARNVRGVFRYGGSRLLNAVPAARAHDGTSGQVGFASPCVKSNTKRDTPAVNSFTTDGEITERQLAAQFFDRRNTSPIGGKPGYSCGRP